jgi:hypothetical protein
MNKIALTMTLLAAISVSGCGSKMDPNEKNFGAAIDQYFAKHGDLCLGYRAWPVDLTAMDIKLSKTWPYSRAAGLAALESTGLVTSQDVEIEGKDYRGKPNGIKYKVKRYQITEAGKKFYREKQVDSIGLGGMTKETQGDLCYGKLALDKVVKWEGPIKFGDYQEASVTYTYKIDGLADWAKDPKIKAAFPGVGQEIDGIGARQSRHGVKLTSQGWEANGLD